MSVLHTDRLRLQAVGDADAPFILALLNDPLFLRFIGDRGVRTEDEAQRYIAKAHKGLPPGLGLWVVTVARSQQPIGICSLLQRETLAHPDLGFAMLRTHCGQGFGYEAASAMLRYATGTLSLEHLLAFTDPSNHASIALLDKLGFSRGDVVTRPGESAASLMFSWTA